MSASDRTTVSHSDYNSASAWSTEMRASTRYWTVDIPELGLGHPVLCLVETHLPALDAGLQAGPGSAGRSKVV